MYLGAFRRADLLAVHGWDERMLSNQDFDLNRRLAADGVVWFDASLQSGYVPRSTFRDLWRQYVRFGRAKVIYWRTTGDRPQPRQRALLAFGRVRLCTGYQSRMVAVRVAFAAAITASGRVVQSGFCVKGGSTSATTRSPRY